MFVLEQEVTANKYCVLLTYVLNTKMMDLVSDRMTPTTHTGYQMIKSYDLAFATKTFALELLKYYVLLTQHPTLYYLKHQSLGRMVYSFRNMWNLCTGALKLF